MIKNIKRFFEPIKYAKKDFVLTVILKIFESILLVLSMNMLKIITEYISTGNSGGIVKFSIFYTILLVIYFIVYYFLRDSENIVMLKIRYNLYKQYLSKILTIDNNYYEKLGTGKLSEISGGNMNWAGVLGDIASEWVVAIFTIIISVITIIFIDFRYCVILFFSVMILIIAYYIAYPHTNKIQKDRKQIWSEHSRFSVRFFMSKNEILTQGKQQKEFDKLFNFMDREKLNIHARNRYHFWIFNFPDFVVYIMQVLIALIFGLGAIKGVNSIGDFAMFVGLLLIIQKAVMTLLKKIRNVDNEFVHISKLWDVYDNTPDMDVYKGNDFLYSFGNIEINNLEFSYGDNKIFNGLNINLEGGKKYAFVGPSGGGKSTLIKLIAGYMKPNNGELKIDLQDLKGVKLASYYKHIGYLSQEPSVFDGTVYENLVYALDYEPNNNQIDEVLKSSKCEFVYDFENKLDTEIGERGIRLSGGQKQRLAIAKIMLKNPNIILLDEPTSSLDSFNEELVSIALNNLFVGKTVIVVAHRLQTVKNSDIIFYLEKGKIVEMGNHEELLALKGKYYRMIELQSGF